MLGSGLSGADLFKIQGTQSSQNLLVVRRIIFGSNIGDDEFLHPIWIIQGKSHSCFSTHRVAQNNTLVNPMMIKVLKQIVYHYIIIKFIAPKTPAMVPLIHQMDTILFFRQVFGMCLPVVPHTQKSVQNDKMIVSRSYDT